MVSMNNQQAIHSILLHLADDAFSSQPIDLWPALQAKIEARSKPHTSQINRYRFGLVVTAIALAFTVFFTLFPQGRVLAQSIWNFFVGIGTTLPEPTPQPVILYDAGPGVTVLTQTPDPNSVPYQEICGPYVEPLCGLEQISQMVSIPVAHLTQVPPGYQFVGATGGPDGVFIKYRRTDNTGNIDISIDKWTGSVNQKLLISSSAEVKTASIGKKNLPGEYVDGIWTSNVGNDSIWSNSMDVHTLRWCDGDLLYTLTVTGDTHPEESGLLPDLEGLVQLANHLGTQVDPIENNPADTGTDLVFTSIQQAQEKAKFQLRTPMWMPKKFQLMEARLDKDLMTVCLVYSRSDGIDSDMISSQLHIIESAKMSVPQPADLVDLANEFAISDSLPVEGADHGLGRYISGPLYDQTLCQRMGNSGQILAWQSNGLVQMIYSDSFIDFSINYPMERSVLQKIAEGIITDKTTGQDEIASGQYKTIDSASRELGFALLRPTQLPAGEVLEIVLADPQNPEQGYQLVYTTFSIHVKPIDNDQPDPNWDDMYGDKITIRGKSGHYLYGAMGESGWDINNWSPETMIWRENHLEISITGNYPTSVARDVLLGIAESLQ